MKINEPETYIKLQHSPVKKKAEMLFCDFENHLLNYFRMIYWMKMNEHETYMKCKKVARVGVCQ